MHKAKQVKLASRDVLRQNKRLNPRTRIHSDRTQNTEQSAEADFNPLIMKRYFSAPKILEVTLILFLGLWLLAFPEIMLSQPPPDFPLQPNQTPIDGGLTAVGLACGAYAVRRLRKKS